MVNVAVKKVLKAGKQGKKGLRYAKLHRNWPGNRGMNPNLNFLVPINVIIYGGGQEREVQ